MKLAEEHLLSNNNIFSEITFKSDPRNLSSARKFVENFAREHGFSEEQVFDIKVAAGEALSNAIEHGSTGKESEIKIIADFSKKSLHISIIDTGIFKKVVKVDDTGDPHHRGRGIPFMLALVDKVTINESKDGTIVKLVKNL